MNIPYNFSGKLPISYIDYLEKFGSDSQSYYFNFYDPKNSHDGEEYFLYSINQLNSNLFSENYKVHEFFKEMTQIDYENRFDNSELSYNDLIEMFVIGSVNEGKIAIDLNDKSLWLIFMDGFVRNIANSFEDFLKNAEKI